MKALARAHATALHERRRNPGAGPALELLHSLAGIALTILAALVVLLPLALLFVGGVPS